MALDLRTLSTENVQVTGNEFIRKLRVLGKQRGVTVSLIASRGKGSHQTLYFGSAFTVLRNPKDELKTGTLHGCAGSWASRLWTSESATWNDLSTR